MSDENATPFMTPLFVATVSTYEMFTNLVEAGFTEDQAISFCAKLASELAKGMESE